MSIALTVPRGYVNTTAQSARGQVYSVLNGKVYVKSADVVSLLDQGFDFEDQVLSALLSAARRVTAKYLVADQALDAAAQGDMFINDTSSNLAINLPLNPNIEDNTLISLLRLGSGTLTITKDAGVTQIGGTAVNANGLAQLLYLGANRWYVFGAAA